ncbi:MAG TPA: RidA family protein [Stellaceae bacterium]|nr:RidA family protein [Stellaceae bacterium]
MRKPSNEAITFINPSELAPPPGYANVVEVRGGRLIYIAGQVATDRHGDLVGKGEFEVQADQAFRNIGAALAAVGCTPRHLVKLTVFVRDMSQIASYRRARDRFLGSTMPRAMPAITLVEVSRLFAEEFLIEIEAVAAAF